MVSAGGSAFFDRVIEHFAGRTVVLRSGCYVSHDGGVYEVLSPLADDSEPLQDALELWGVVLSRPEPGRIIVGVGRRDAPFDAGLPRPVAYRSADGEERPLDGASVVRLNDQHATISAEGPEVGDLVRCTISHPCGAFDRWRVIALVDDERRITGAVHTVF
jgi:D-serine deaminase-like pyridoxal phosphate-dependent protein